MEEEQYNDENYERYLNFPSIVPIIQKLGEYYLTEFYKDSLILDKGDKLSKFYSVSMEFDSNIKLQNGELSGKRRLTLSCSDNRKLVINCAKSKKIIYINIKYELPQNHTIESYIRLGREIKEDRTVGDYLSGVSCTNKDIKYTTLDDFLVKKEYASANEFNQLVFNTFIDVLKKYAFTEEELQMFLSAINDILIENLRKEQRRIYLCLVGDGISR